MKWANSKVLLPVTTFFTGVVWALMGIFKYGFLSEKGIGSGFFPAIMGIALCLASIAAVYQGTKEKKVHYNLSALYPVFACVLIILSSLLLGMMVSILVYTMTWLRFFEKQSLKTSLMVTIGLFALVYGVFGVWLQVPFPKGAIYNLIIG